MEWKIKNGVLCFLSFSLWLSSCKKEDSDKLPEPSTSGKNFLACKVNGKRQVYSGLSSYMSPGGVSFAHYTPSAYDGVQIFASGRSDFIDNITLWVDEDSTHKAEVGVIYSFQKGDGRNHNHAFYQIHPAGVVSQDYITGNNSGWVRFSRLDSIASGTFEFTAYYDVNSSDRNEPDTIRFTEGRFDISRK